MKRATSKLLVGRKIIGFKLNKWTDENGDHYNPVITLDNGADVVFSVTETEDGGGYGITPAYFENGLKSKDTK